MSNRYSSSSSKGKQPAYPEERNRDEGRRSGAKEKRSEKDDRLNLDIQANNGPRSNNNNKSGGNKITGGNANANENGGKGTGSGGSSDCLNNMTIPKKHKVNNYNPDPASIQNPAQAPYIPVPIPPAVKAPFIPVHRPVRNPPPPCHDPLFQYGFDDYYDPQPLRHAPLRNPPPPPPAAAVDDQSPFEIGSIPEDPMLPKVGFPLPPADFILPSEPVEAKFYAELTLPEAKAAAEQFSDAARAMLYEVLKDSIMEDQCKPLRAYMVFCYKGRNINADVDENNPKYWPLVLFCNFMKHRYDASGMAVEKKAFGLLSLRNDIIHCNHPCFELNQYIIFASYKLQALSKELRVLVPVDIAKVLQPLIFKSVTISTDDVVTDVKEIRKEVSIGIATQHRFRDYIVGHQQVAKNELLTEITEINSKVLLLQNNMENVNNNLMEGEKNREDLKKQMDVILKSLEEMKKNQEETKKNQQLILELLRKNEEK